MKKTAIVVVDFSYDDRCNLRRRHTNARCEYPRGHDGDEHCGRDTAGRWHTWLLAERTP